MRRRPQQARSRLMVERLVAAGHTVLVRDGYDAFSTNRVADEAGVSPGSLYQYFPDKGAIIDVVIERWSAEVAERVAASLADRIGDVGTTMVRETALALVAALEADAPLLRVVWEELPTARNRGQRLALEQRVRELVTAYLAVHGHRTPHPTATAWVLVLAIENVAVRWVLDRPDIARETLIDELVALAEGMFGVRR